MLPFFYVLQAGVAITMLLTASIMDVRSRSVKNWVFIFFGSLGLGITILSWLMGGYTFEVRHMIVSIGITYSVAWLLYYVNVYQGADAKSLVALSLIFPSFHHPVYPILHPFAAIMTLTNTALIAVPTYLLFRFLSKDKRVPMLPLLLGGFILMFFLGDISNLPRLIIG